jgi:alpha-L-rhamnosidase
LRAGADAYHGWFVSGSDLLNRIWYAGAYTTQLDQVPQDSLGSPSAAVATNPLPVIMDGAKRDRAVWAGDLNVSAPTVFYSTATNAYVRSSLQLLASYQSASGEMAGSVSPVASLGTSPGTAEFYSASYSMDVVMDIAGYFRFTGDLAFVRREWPSITRELAWNHSHVDARGLLLTSKGDGLDWDYYDGPKIGAVTAYNAIYVATLRDAADMADALGYHAEATSDRAQASSVADAVNEYLWDPTLGAYSVSDAMPGTVAQDGNSLAILDGIAPRSEIPEILAAMRTALWTNPYGPLPFGADAGYRSDISPFSTNLEVQARFVAGDSAGALELIDRLWGHMLAPGPDETGTLWEVVAADGTPGLGGVTSLAHGWASGPTVDLSADVLGIEPTAPGFATWRIEPHPGAVRWAEGQAPTPRGPIHVRWDTGGGGALTLDVASPSGTRGTIQMPVPASTATVTVNGRRVKGATVTTIMGERTVRFPVRGGGHLHVSVSTDHGD